MARETRHLKISNIPADLTESKLLDYFSHYGRVQKVDKLSGGDFAVVSFIDIRTAAKAMATDEHEVEGRGLKASYYEPGGTGGSSGAVIQIYDTSEALESASPRSGSTIGKHQSTTGHRSSSRESASGSRRRRHNSVSSSREDRDRKERDRSRGGSNFRGSYGSQYLGGFRRAPFRFHAPTSRGGFFRARISGRPWRGRGNWNGDHRRSRGGYLDHFGGNNSARRSYSNSGLSPYNRPGGSLNSRQNSWDPLSHQPRNRNPRQNGSERRRRRSGSSGSTNPSKSPSHRSSKSSISPSPSVSSKGSRNKVTGSCIKRAGTASSVGSSAGEKSEKRTPATPAGANDSAGGSELRRELTESPSNGDTVDPACRVGLVVRDLPVRSTDSSVKDGLFYTFKKLGKVLSVKVTGTGQHRYGIVTFKKTIGNIFVQVDYGSALLNDLFIDRMFRSKQLMGKKDGGLPAAPHSLEQIGNKNLDRKNYNSRDFECTTMLGQDGFSNNNNNNNSGSNFSSPRKDGSVSSSRNRSKESSYRGLDSGGDVAIKETPRTSSRHDVVPGKRGTAIKRGGNESNRRHKLARRPSSGDSRRRKRSREDKRRHRRVVGSGASSHSTKSSSSSSSEESSRDDYS